MECIYKLKDQCEKAVMTIFGERVSHSACSVCVQLEILKEIKRMGEQR